MSIASPMTIHTGRLSAATWLASPNFNKRPENIAIDAIVIHNISLPPMSLALAILTVYTTSKPCLPIN